MKIRLLAVHAAAFCFMTSGLAHAAPKRVSAHKAPAKTAASTQSDETPEPDETPDIAASVLEQLFNAMEPIKLQAGFTLKFSERKPFAIKNLHGIFAVPFGKDIVVPLGAPTGTEQTDKLLPVLRIATENLIIEAEAVSDPKQANGFKSTVSFRKKGKSAKSGLSFDLRNARADIFAIQLNSVELALTGPDAVTGEVKVSGNCIMTQSMLDVDTGKVAPQKTACNFKGFFMREIAEGTAGADDPSDPGSYDFELTYDGLPPAKKLN